MAERIKIEDIAEIDEYLEKESDRIGEIIEESEEEERNFDDFYALKGETEFEKKIIENLNCENKKIEFRIAKEKIGNFERKMRRIKSIKSRRFRKIQRKIKETRREDEMESSSSDLKPADILEHENHAEINGEKGGVADDIFMEEFAAEKKAIVEKERPKHNEYILPGWNEWTMKGSAVAPNKHNVIREHINGIEKTERRDYKLNNIIINEAVDRKTEKLAVEIPKNIKESDYLKSLNEPVDYENYRKKAFRFFQNRK